MRKKNTRLYHPEVDCEIIREKFIDEVLNANTPAKRDFHLCLCQWFYSSEGWRCHGIQKKIDSISESINIEDYCHENFKFEEKWSEEIYLIKRMPFDFFIEQFSISRIYDVLEYKYIFSETGLLKYINKWLKRWNLYGKRWIYKSLGNVYFSKQEVDISSNIPGIKDDDLSTLPPFFMFERLALEDQSIEEYYEQELKRFESHLKNYLHNLIKILKANGYKEIRRQRDTSYIKWLVYWTLGIKTKEEILNEIYDETGKDIDLRILDRHFNRLEKDYDLPYRKEKQGRKRKEI